MLFFLPALRAATVCFYIVAMALPIVGDLTEIFHKVKAHAVPTGAVSIAV